MDSGACYLFWKGTQLRRLSQALAYALPFFGALLNVVAAIAGQAVIGGSALRGGHIWWYLLTNHPSP